MAIIHNKNVFSWKNFENIADFERFSFLLRYIPDEKLVRTLEKHRGRGRNDYPVRAMTAVLPKRCSKSKG
jgi:hypothetical protein